MKPNRAKTLRPYARFWDVFGIRCQWCDELSFSLSQFTFGPMHMECIRVMMAGLEKWEKEINKQMKEENGTFTTKL